MENSLNILAESLDRKLAVLQKIQAYNKKQEAAFLGGAVELEEFDAAIGEKGRLIEEINGLDAGFEALYQRISEELKTDRGRYAAQIRELQQKIAAVTELGVAVQAQEARNKQLVEQYFAKRRAGIREGRVSSRAAYNYYKSMSNTNAVPPQFMDSKQ